jgi:hypothetical protein
VTTKLVGDTMTAQHLPEAHCLSIIDQQTRAVLLVPLFLVRAVPAAMFGKVPDMARLEVQKTGRNPEIE